MAASDTPTSLLVHTGSTSSGTHSQSPAPAPTEASQPPAPAPSDTFNHMGPSPGPSMYGLGPELSSINSRGLSPLRPITNVPVDNLP